MTTAMSLLVQHYGCLFCLKASALVVIKITRCYFRIWRTGCLCPLATDAAGQLNVLGHDGDTLGVDGCQVGVLKEAHQVGLSGLLQSQHCAALEPQVGLEVLGDLTDQPLERQLADEQLSRLLVLPDLAQGDGSRPVPASRGETERQLRS